MNPPPTLPPPNTAATPPLSGTPSRSLMQTVKRWSSALQPLASLRNLIANPRCLLCTSVIRPPVNAASASPGAGLLCECCYADLPWNRLACPRCARPLSTPPARLCAPCLQRKLPFAAGYSAFHYGTPIDSAIHRLKYHADFLAARWLADALADQLGPALRERARSPALPLPTLLIPVPLHPSRLRSRGYNQSIELARPLLQRLRRDLLTAGIALPTQLDLRSAQRLRATEDQIGKTALERRKNVRGAFAIRDAEKMPLQGQRIALLDDVLTTASTCAELARRCKRAGATQVEVWAVARVE